MIISKCSVLKWDGQEIFDKVQNFNVTIRGEKVNFSNENHCNFTSHPIFNSM